MASLRNNQNISYRSAREYLYGTLALQSDEQGTYIQDVYCNKKIRTFKVIPNASIMNCEHTWPQSHFSKRHSKSTQKNDLHHLYPVDSRANTTRSNKMFAEVLGGVVRADCSASHKGRAIGAMESAFEPPEEHKGNVARAMFYFSDRYDMRIGPLEEEYLREWHESDPVDEREIRRNNLIEEFQGNRNKFIDDPELVYTIRDF